MGGALPSVLAGFIITYASWHALFLIMIPLAVLLLLCSIKILPADEAHGNMKLDATGFALTTIGSFVLLFSFSNLSVWGFSARFAAVALAGVLCMAVYIKKSWSREDAMLNLSVLRYPRYVAALIADCMNIIAMYMITFMMPLFLQNGLGLSAATTGTILLPCSIVTIAAMPFATKVLTQKGEKALALTGIIILLLGSSVFIRMDASISVVLVTIAMCVRSFGLGFMNLLSTNTAMAAVPSELSGHASALTNWLRQMIGALTTSAASTIIGLRLIAENAVTTEQIADVYVSSMSTLMIFSCCTFFLIIPIALKFFRGKNEMN